MENRFKGELKYIEPNKLVYKNEHNKTDGFFLGLGVVFNDIKGLLLFEKILTDNFEKPSNDEITSHAGNYGGTRIQIQKLLISTIHEFFKFIEKSDDVFEEDNFKEVMQRLSKTDKQFWDDIVDASHGRFINASELLKSLAQIRSNIGFHYDWNGKIFRRSYINRFFDEIQDDKNKLAYYTIGDTMAETRFFFSDAVIEEAIHVAAGKKPGKKSIGSIPLDKFEKQVLETMELICALIATILKIFIQYRRNLPY